MSGKGPSLKNTAFIKRGLTPEEARRLETITKADRDRWTELMAQPLNKWKLIK